MGLHVLARAQLLGDRRELWLSVLPYRSHCTLMPLRMHVHVPGSFR